MKLSVPRPEWKSVAEFFILLALVVAPLNFASTRSGGMGVLSALGFGSVLAWIMALAKQGQCPRLEHPLIWAGGIVIAAGVLWTSGALSVSPCEAFTVRHWDKIVERWPDSIVWRTLPQTIAFLTSIVLTGWVVVDRLRHSSAFLRRIAQTAVITGVCVAGLAFAQNISHATGIYWQSHTGLTTSFCGPFYHHTSAGAFLNLVWPLGLVLAWGAVQGGHWRKALFWGSAACFISAAHIAHISRMPQALAVVGLVTLAFLLPVSQKNKGFRLRFVGVFVLGVLAVAALFSAGSKTGEIRQRWRGVKQSVQETLNNTPSPAPRATPLESLPMRSDLFIDFPHSGFLGVRAVGWVAAVKAIAARPLEGHGPANWMAAASHATDDPFVRTFFQFLQFVHNDYLQFWVEWGLVAGSALIFIFLRPFFMRGWRKLPPLELGVKVALAMVLVQSLWDFPLQMPSLLFYAGVFAAVGWAGLKSSKA